MMESVIRLENFYFAYNKSELVGFSILRTLRQ